MNQVEWAKAVREQTLGEIRFLPIDEMITILSAALDVLADELAQEGNVALYHFGYFEVVEVPARRNFDGLNGGWRMLPAQTTVRFRPSRRVVMSCKVRQA